MNMPATSSACSRGLKRSFLSAWIVATIANTGAGAQSRELAHGPDHVDITWMSISNMYYEIGPLRIVTDGYITRLPRESFSGGGGGYAVRTGPFTPDVAAVTRVMNGWRGSRR